SCSNTPTPGYCDDGRAGTNDSYDLLLDICRNTLIAGYCDDAKAGTDDAYHLFTDTCSHTPITGYCDDGKAGTTDIYDLATDTCNSTPRPDYCDDGKAGTTDVYNLATDSCSNTPIPNYCDDGRDNTIDLYDVATDTCNNIPMPDPTPDPTLGVTAFFPGSDWNDYVVNEGPIPFAASGFPCDGGESGGHNACLHAGEYRTAAIDGFTSCDGLTATDFLDAFYWRCDSTSNPVRMVSTGLKPGVRLSDLLHVPSMQWLPNAIRVSGSLGEFYQTPPQVWWNNPVVPVSAGGVLSAPGTIHVVTGDAGVPYDITADQVALVVPPGRTITGAGDGGVVIRARNRSFLWVEGSVDATDDAHALRWENVTFSALYGFSASNPSNEGVYVHHGGGNRLSDLFVTRGGYSGVILEQSSGNLLLRVSASDNGLAGLYLLNAPDNVVDSVTASENGTWGAVLERSNGVFLSDVTTADNNAYGVWVYASSGVTLMNVAATGNGTSGVYLYAAKGATMLNTAAADNGEIGVFLQDSDDSRFSGALKIGHNRLWDCVETGGIRPGIGNDNCENRDGSDATLEMGVSLSASFVGGVFDDDVTNPDDIAGAQHANGIHDWDDFDNDFRHWVADTGVGLEPSARSCEDGNCRIWDWRVRASDTVLSEALPVPTGEDSKSHHWSDGSVSDYLPNAVELTGDGEGDDDGLCESGEDCRHTRNLASYQGEGSDTTVAIIGSGGQVEDVKLMQRPNRAP
ncbi:MAG: right-handed parallel beta-helix repeat-containing protein, partial [Leptospirillia bacterium]